jgi:heme-degrading monooxygenase HmoA
MILECAVLDVRADETARFEAAFAQAQAIISASPGYLSHELQRCVEKPNDPFPTVEHYEAVAGMKERK